MSQSDAGAYSVALEMVRLGPSSHNGQPWRIILDGDVVKFFHVKEYSILKQLDMGIAFCHFDLATKELGIEGVWSKEKINDSNYVTTWCKS